MDNEKNKKTLKDIAKKLMKDETIEGPTFEKYFKTKKTKKK